MRQEAVSLSRVKGDLAPGLSASCYHVCFLPQELRCGHCTGAGHCVHLEQGPQAMSLTKDSNCGPPRKV